MTVSIHADDYRKFYELTKSADRNIRIAARKRIRESAKRYGTEIVSEGSRAMPRRGGLADYVAAKGHTPTVSQTATGARLVLGKKAGPQIGRMNDGNLRHPLFGRRKSEAGKSLWVDQSVPAGSWTEAIQKRLPDIRDDVAKELDSVLKELNP